MVNLMLKTKDKWEGSLIRADPIFAGMSFAVVSAPLQKVKDTLISSCILHINYCSQTLRGEGEERWERSKRTILDPQCFQDITNGGTGAAEPLLTGRRRRFGF